MSPFALFLFILEVFGSAKLTVDCLHTIVCHVSMPMKSEMSFDGTNRDVGNFAVYFAVHSYFILHAINFNGDGGCS